jgi:hypothetical protein
MYSRVTQLEIDTLRISADDAVELFSREVAPTLRTQPGYRGVLVLSTPAGSAMLISFWETEEQAATEDESGFYPDTLARYLTIFRAPPGRGRYAVAFSDPPTPVDA